jgi:hypothetical protein
MQYLYYFNPASRVIYIVSVQLKKRVSSKPVAHNLLCFTPPPSESNVFAGPASAAFKSQQSETTCNRSHISTTRRASCSEIQIWNAFGESFTISTPHVIKPSVHFPLHLVHKRSYSRQPGELSAMSYQRPKINIYLTTGEHFLRHQYFINVFQYKYDTHRHINWWEWIFN